MKRKNPATSTEAYKSLDPEKISQIKKDIVMTLRILGPSTYEQVAIHLKKDPSKIWKRMSEAKNDGLIERTEIRRKMASGREGFVWKATDALPATEKALSGTAVVDYSRSLIASKFTQERLF